jgi:uncharacterized protein (TIGR01777 family)
VKVAVSGAHGLIGGALVDRLSRAGHDMVRLVRVEPGPGEVRWDPGAGQIDAASLEGLDAAVHLAGVGIGDRRWNEAHKRRVLDSRVQGTGLLASALAALDRPPAALLSASAIGIYGDRGDEILTEESPTGTGFLAELCVRWEAATGPAERAGIRVVHLRSGIVQATSGGALGKQLPLFRFGLGGRLGSGRQYVSWISLHDEISAIEHALSTETLRGPANLTAPDPVTNAEYTAALGAVLHRPAALRVPRGALRLALGREMAAEMLLGGQRVLPAALEASGFRFEQPALPAALRDLLG